MHQEEGMEEPTHTTGEDLSTCTSGNTTRRKRKNPGRSSVDGSQNGSPSSQDRGNPIVDGTQGQIQQSVIGQKNDLPPTAEDYRARFFETYHKEAEDYDREFIKKYDEDLNTTLIFAGLFSAVASAFIIEVNSQLQPDPNEETAALLRVLIYKMDNTTFGGDVPTVPQWSGPPHMIVHVQAILFASLAVSLFSAFLAMLGKQWLNQYASVDMRGSAIERSQDRQRKLDGIITWYFDHVMQSLPLMLQAGLLLLGCGLSRYLWEVNTTVASVVLGVTSFGVLFYLFIVFAGATYVSCPYQTPGAHILRHVFCRISDIFHQILQKNRILRGVFSTSTRGSTGSLVLRGAWYVLWGAPEWNRVEIVTSLLCTPLLPIWFIMDACWATVRFLAFLSRRMPFRLQQTAESRTVALDLRCVLWTLRTSLDGPVRFSALNYLPSMTSIDSDPIIAVHCFDILLGCVEAWDSGVVINRGMEQLATASALCCLHTLSYIAVMDPTLWVLENVRQRYTKAFKPRTRFDGLPFSHILGAVHHILYSPGVGGRAVTLPSPMSTISFVAAPIQGIRWEDYKPSSNEHVTVAHGLTRLTQFEFQRRGKVPCWLLRFALHSLSQSPPPPTSVITSCLSIVAIGLYCGLPETTTSDESALLERVSYEITRKLMVSAEMARGIGPDFIHPGCKAISTLFPYVVRRERRGNSEMLDAFLDATRVSKRFMWTHIGPYIPILFDEASPRAIVLLSPYVDWRHVEDRGNPVSQWASAVSTVPYTNKFCRSVVDALLHIASDRSMLPRIPVSIWVWLVTLPSLPPECQGRSRGTTRIVVYHVLTLGNIEILKSYLLLVWSEWDHMDTSYGGLDLMRSSIRWCFGGIGMWGHRKDLIKRLDRVLRRLARGLGYLEQYKPSTDEDHIRTAKEQYGELKRELLTVDGEAVDTLAQSHSTFMCALPLPCP